MSNPLSASIPQRRNVPSVNVAAIVEAAPLPFESPDEVGFSVLLESLCLGPPPPAKLALFDVQSVPRTEVGLDALVEERG
jgi:hypothetical protein